MAEPLVVGRIELAPHTHHTGPARCCPEEPAQHVIARLEASPPARRGAMHPRHKVWKGESEAKYLQRVAAHAAALAREASLLREPSFRCPWCGEGGMEKAQAQAHLKLCSAEAGEGA